MLPSSLSKGYTLIELCVTLTIMSVLAFSAVSIAPQILQAKQADDAIKNVFRLFRLARTEAITKGAVVTICPLDLSGRCTNGWNQTLSMFVDEDNSRSLNQGEAVVKTIKPPSSGRIEVAPQNRRYFQFGPLGGAKGTLGNVTYCSEPASDGMNTRQVVISFSGRLRLARDEDRDGIAEYANGIPVTCS